MKKCPRVESATNGEFVCAVLCALCTALGLIGLSQAARIQLLIYNLSQIEFADRSK